MRDARIGRLAAAALHESLAAHHPFRVEFYEYWLQPPRLRAGTVGMAPFLAVLSFLRQEGEIYHTVVEGAGTRAADWIFAEVPALARLRWRWLSRRWRRRVALRLLQRVVAETTPTTRARIRVARLEARLELVGSPFCQVRSRAALPLCGFYAAALVRLCELLDLDAHVQKETCQATGADACSLAVALLPHPRIEPAAADPTGLGAPG